MSWFLSGWQVIRGSWKGRNGNTGTEVRDIRETISESSRQGMVGCYSVNKSS